MNNKGQALVEFVLILPVFLFLMMSIYDFGMINNLKSKLESDSSDIIMLYNNGRTIEDIKQIYNKYLIEVDDSDMKYTKITITSSIKTVTPGLSKIFGNPHVEKIERYIPNA